MLEDNAELLGIYADAHLAFPDAGFDRVARDVIRYLDAVLLQPETALWSGSQDADEHYYTLDAAGREGHDAPFVDRTLYTSWNALAARAYLRCADVLDDPSLRERARRAAHAIGTHLRDATGALCRSNDGSGPRLPGLLEDAAAALGLLLDLGRVDDALAIARAMRTTLADEREGGFFDAPERAAPGRLARRERPLEDNAAAAEGFVRLAVATGDDEWRDVAFAALRAFVGEYRQWGQFASSYANAVARALREPVAVVVVGSGAAADSLARTARTAGDPDVVTLTLDPARDAAAIAQRGLPPGRTAAYVCLGTTCSAPLSDEGSLHRELGQIAAARA